MPRKFSNFNIMQALTRPYLNDGLPLAPKSVFELISLYMLILEFGPINSNNNNMDAFMHRAINLDSTYILEKILPFCHHDDILGDATIGNSYKICMYMLTRDCVTWDYIHLLYSLNLKYISDEYIINRFIKFNDYEDFDWNELIDDIVESRRYKLLKWLLENKVEYIRLDWVIIDILYDIYSEYDDSYNDILKDLLNINYDNIENLEEIKKSIGYAMNFNKSKLNEIITSSTLYLTKIKY